MKVINCKSYYANIRAARRRGVALSRMAVLAWRVQETSCQKYFLSRIPSVFSGRDVFQTKVIRRVFTLTLTLVLSPSPPAPTPPRVTPQRRTASTASSIFRGLAPAPPLTPLRYEALQLFRTRGGMNSSGTYLPFLRMRHA